MSCISLSLIFENDFGLARKVESKNMASRKSITNNYSKYHSSSPKLIRLIPQQMDEIREKVLCFNYDKKYSKGHKCSENK